jgi:hypothetical protein
MNGTKRRSLIIKLSFTVVLTVLLSEVVLRVYSAMRPSAFAYHPSRYKKFKARPGDMSYGFSINTDGFKDKPFTLARASNEFRIAAIGDSFVFSMVPYEHSFCTLLEQREADINVMNFGVIGTGPEDYVTILKNDVVPYEPDMAIIFLYAGNDFLPKRKKWYDYSATATILHHIAKASRAYQGQDVRQNYTYDDNMTPFSYGDFVSVEATYAETYLSHSAVFEKAFDRAMRNVLAIREICDTYDIALRVVIIPDRMQFQRKLLDDVAMKLNRPVSNFDLLRPQRILTQSLSAKGFGFVDLYNAFADEQRRAFVNNDIHLNIWGNEIVANSIPAEWLRRGQ